eukprot:1161982-Pelagomonas_calceolata.AAC.8
MHWHPGLKAQHTCSALAFKSQQLSVPSMCWHPGLIAQHTLSALAIRSQHIFRCPSQNPPKSNAMGSSCLPCVHRHVVASRQAPLTFPPMPWRAAAYLACTGLSSYR